jgi:hypothetical protein
MILLKFFKNCILILQLKKEQEIEKKIVELKELKEKRKRVEEEKTKTKNNIFKKIKFNNK